MTLLNRRLMLINKFYEDEYIITVSPSNSKIQVYVSTGSKGCSVYVGQEKQDIEANQSNKQLWFEGVNEISDVIIRGDFTGVYPSVSKTFKEIKKWPLKKDTTLDKQFYQAYIDFDIEIPKRIKYLTINSYTAITGIDGANLILHDEIESIDSFGLGSDIVSAYFKNAELEDNIYYIDNIAMQPYTKYDTVTEYTFRDGTRKIANHFFSVLSGTLYSFYYSGATSIKFNEDGSLEEIPSYCCHGCNNSNFTSITIPSSIKKIGEYAFGNSAGAMSLTSIIFNQPKDMEVYIETYAFKVKTAREMTIYTDNEMIKDYNWSGDNITATILHLDGSTWE